MHGLPDELPDCRTSHFKCELASVGNVGFALLVTSYSSVGDIGEQTINREAAVNEIKLGTVTLDYMLLCFL